MVRAKIQKGIEHFASYEAFILIGLIMCIATIMKIFGYMDFSSDWLWFLTGACLVIEGIIALLKQRKFEKKFKIVEKAE